MQLVDDTIGNQPIYWFTLLALATERGDLEQAAQAVRELHRLGIDVTYRCRPRLQVVSDIRAEGRPC